MIEEQVMHEKLEKDLAKRKRLPNDLRQYIESFVYSLLILAFIAGYYFMLNPRINSRILNKSVADVSIILIGLSLVLSSICYFWDFADKFIVYRKHLGVIGFWYAFLHGILSLVPERFSPFLVYYLNENRINAFLPAAVSLVLFAVMTVISNRYSIQKIGPKRWKFIMRIGFLAYGLGIIHFFLKTSSSWSAWFFGQDTMFPPFSLISFLFAVTVLILRTALWVKTSHKKKV